VSKPLLRWAGGKRWLAKEIKKILPNYFNNYYEPFCGSCAIFYSLREVLGGKNVYLSDLNYDLINFYKILQSSPSALIGNLKLYENTESFYYFLRSYEPNDPVEAAARFYYLNRTSFNGIYRVNLKGKYNVPYGFKKYLRLFDFDLIIENSEFIKDVNFVYEDFFWVINVVEKDDFVFLDPPYTVSHNRNGFIKYNQKLFSVDDQHRLKDFIDKISQKKANYLLTNAHHSVVYDIFSVNSSGREVNRYTPISGKRTGRTHTKEYIFFNYGTID
jgi:DNA adenine methylase